MKKFTSYIILFLFPFALGIVYLFSVPLDESFSYHFVKGECDDKASWIYHRIFMDKRNIDIAFSGASQTGSAIMDELIENELTQKCGQQLNVTNLGYCQRGRDIQYIMLRDLFQQKHPKILVVEVYEDEPKKGHPVFPYLAGTSELFNSCIWLNQRFPGAIWKGIVVRFEYLKYRILNVDASVQTNLPEYGYRPSDHIAADDVLQQNEINWKNRLQKTKPEIMRSTELNYSRQYLKKIAALADKNQCKIYFLYLPESGSKIKTPMLENFYRELAEIIYLPEKIINEKTNWKDGTHFNDKGAEQVSDFIISYGLNSIDFCSDVKN